MKSLEKVAKSVYIILFWDGRVINDRIKKICTSFAGQRYEIPSNQYVWEVDVFKGKLTGLVLAEIELTNENDLFDLPNWVGQEVSTDPTYLNANLIHLDKWEKVD